MLRSFLTDRRCFGRIILFLTIMSSTIIFAQPKLDIIPGVEFTMGTVYKGMSVTKELTIRNVGSDTLVVSDVSAQCGCTTTKLSRQKLAPKESENLSITFNSTGYDGPVTKHVYLDSNDPEDPEMEIEFKATVIQSLKPNPGMITFNVSRLDSSYAAEITLLNSTFQSIKILSIVTRFGGLNVSLFKNELMPGEQTVLQAILTPSREGSFQGSLVLKTDFSAQPSIDIGVFQLYKQR